MPIAPRVFLLWRNRKNRLEQDRSAVRPNEHVRRAILDMVINIEIAGRRVTSVSVPQKTTEVTIEVPPPNGGAKKEERPQIVLTDR
jgi:hypothetical protein